MLCRFLNGLENWKDYMESEVKQMSIERVTAERALEHLKAGHSIIILQAADMTSLTIADWLTSDLAVEVPDEHPVDENSQAGGGKPLRLVGVRSWIGARSKPCMMPDGPMQRLRMRWDVPWPQSIPA